MYLISIHALLAESDVRRNSHTAKAQISIHALLAESDSVRPTITGTLSISIHALLAESDDQNSGTSYSISISIHALLAESDAYIMTTIICIVLFLSTLSLRRATRCFLCGSSRQTLFLSTLSLRRATTQDPELRELLFISIHALLAESDDIAKINKRLNAISIHALLAESDQTGHCFLSADSHFYPRSPCGERPGLQGASKSNVTFLSTLSLRRATSNTRVLVFIVSISIHALLAESDAARR